MRDPQCYLLFFAHYPARARTISLFFFLLTAQNIELSGALFQGKEWCRGCRDVLGKQVCSLNEIDWLWGRL